MPHVNQIDLFSAICKHLEKQGVKNAVPRQMNAAIEARNWEIATKLYAKARKITVDEAADNIRDARLNREECRVCPTCGGDGDGVNDHCDYCICDGCGLMFVECDCCTDCDGDGVCPTCGGGSDGVNDPCDYCDCTGVCPTCNGDGAEAGTA